MFEESADKTFIDKFKEIFSLNDIEFRSLLSEVKSFKKREETDWKNKQNRIADLTESLEKGNLTKRERFKIMRSIAYLSRRIGKETCFGGLITQRKLTRECNRQTRDEVKIAELKTELKENRVLPFFIMGEANQIGNRFFDFSDIANGKLIYKPCKEQKYSIAFKVSKRQAKELEIVAELTKKKGLSVSVMLSTNYLHLTYDECKVNGYAVDEVGRREGIKKIKSKHHPKDIESELIKAKYREYYEEQRQRMLLGKQPNRCLAVDLNPEYIGYSILDKKNGNAYKIVTCGIFDLSKLSKKSGKSSSHLASKYLTNKRRYETSIIVKELFKMAKHYRCSNFIIEELQMKNRNVGSHEANRKINNVWNRKPLTRLIVRRCNESGIQLIEVNPCYSSFIGNIQHPYVDPTNASIEIGRRGLFKYENGGFYPSVSEEDYRTLDAKFGDVVDCSTFIDWISAYKSLTKSFNKIDFAYRLRASIDKVNMPYRCFSINSYKSKNKLIIFN